MVTFSPQMISIKSIFTNTLSFINPQNALFGLKSLKKYRSFRCTGLLGSSKLVHTDAKKSDSFYLRFSVEWNELTPSF